MTDRPQLDPLPDGVLDKLRQVSTSTLATRRPVRRSTSYCTRLRSVDATSERLRPYSTTTLSSIVTPSSPLPPTLIPCRRGSRFRSRLRDAMPTTP